MAPDMESLGQRLPGEEGGGGGKRRRVGRREEEGCEGSEGGEREHDGAPHAPEHRLNSWRKRVGIGIWGSGREHPVVSDLASPISFTPSRVVGRTQTFGEVDLGLCSYLCSFPLASQFAHLYTGLGTGRGAEA